jgi:hypothetical protein
MREIRRDETTGLAMLVDDRDPPRYYASTKARLDLIGIGDLKAAATAFDERVRKAQRLRKPPKP